MPFSATRMMVYAMLSAVEEDLRDLVLARAEGQSAGDVLGTRLHTRAIDRLRADRGLSAGAEPDLGTLLPYTDLGDLFELVNVLTPKAGDPFRAQLADHNAAIERLLPIRKRIAHVRPLDYEDFSVADVTTEKLARTGPAYWQEVGRTRTLMQTDPSFVYGVPQPTYEEDESGVFYRLPLPDYDDTGFMGRTDDVRKLLGLIKGPWPVVSVVGEGGLGKTSLALKVAYDLLDDVDCPFDAIVFSTSKNAQLTPGRVEEISTEVKDALGLLTDAASAFGAPDDPSGGFTDLLFMMENYRVLLVLDNLENVLDDTIRQFLDALPAGSKVLVTSRIGLGDYEKRIPLKALTSSDAVALLRTSATMSNVESLKRLPHDSLASLCSRMQHNPLFIRWFVASVAAGSNPETVLGSPDLFLDYCLSNVYNYLSTNAVQVLSILQALPGERSLAELTYLNEDNLASTENALQELLVTNVVTMNVRPQGAVCEASYDLGEIARMYLLRHHPLAAERQQAITARAREMQSVSDGMKRRTKGLPFERRTLSTRGRNDLLVAKHLRAAQVAADDRDFDTAFDSIRTAMSLAPDWFECHRVEAQVHMAANNVANAEASFSAAIEMQPRSGPLLVHYADFRRSHRNDHDGALELIERALVLEPNEPEVLRRHAELCLRTLSFEAAMTSVNQMHLLADTASKKSLLDAWHLSVMCRASEALFAAETSDLLKAIGSLEQLRRDFDAAPSSVRPKLHSQVERSLAALFRCERSRDEGVKARAAAHREWVEAVHPRSNQVLSRGYILGEDFFAGEIKTMVLDRRFGFLIDQEGEERFFHQRDVASGTSWEGLRRGTHVRFQKGISAQGLAAFAVCTDD